MASRRHLQRRGSMEEPLTMSSFNHLTEELNRLHEDFSPSCNEHQEKIHKLFDELKEVYISSTSSAIKGAKMSGLAVLLMGLALFVFDEDVSIFVAAFGVGLAIAGGYSVACGRYKKTQTENLKQTIKEELQGIQDKSNSIIDVMEKICQHSVEILRDTRLSDHKAQALSQHFAYGFQKRHLIQENDSSTAGDQMSKIKHLSGNLAEMIAKVSSVPEILKEIIEDEKRRHDKPTHEQINKMVHSKNVEKFINDMQKGICELRNKVKNISQIAESISNL